METPCTLIARENIWLTIQNFTDVLRFLDAQEKIYIIIRLFVMQKYMSKEIQ